MDLEKMYKYSVIINNCIDNNVIILFTTAEYNKSLEYLNNYIENTMEFSNPWYKCYFESATSVCIYKYHYFTSKQLVTKLQIIKFVDVID